MKWTEPKCYAVKHKKEDVLAASQSGGIFTALSDKILEENGVIYGCVLDENHCAVHVRAEDESGRNRMRGSKYIQSRVGYAFRSVKADLSVGRKVLFSGTSCQIAGLRAFLGRDYPNLLCVDIICHGVPSPMVWKAYLQWREQKHGSRVVTANFRNKALNGWRGTTETLDLENGEVIKSKIFAMLFYDHNTIRPCCYTCPYKATMHPGDITIGDYWGIENAAPEFDDNKGVSLVLVNNQRGEEFLEQVKGSLLWKQTALADSMQLSLVRAFKSPRGRARFWQDFRELSFDQLVYRHCGGGIVSKVKRKIRILLQRIEERV